MQSRFRDSRWTTAVVGTVALFVASVVPSPLKRHPEWKWVGPDKFLHLVAHAAYAVALADALRGGRFDERQAAVLAVCGSTVHSLVTGRVQERVPGRAFEVADVLASLLGSVLAVGGWYAKNGTRARDGE